MRRLRVRSSRPPHAAAVPDVRLYGLGELRAARTACRGLKRPAVAGAVRPEYFRTVSSLLGRGSAQGESSEARVPAPSLAIVLRALTAAAVSSSSPEALLGLVEAARAVVGADVALVRALDESSERLEAVAVAAPPALAAELEGTVLPAAELPRSPVTELAEAPAAVRRVAEQCGATQLLLVPAQATGHAVSLELFRAGEPFGAEHRLAAELCAAQAALVLRAFAAGGDASSLARPALELAGEALAAALHEHDAAAEVVRLAAGVAGASAAILWQSVGEGIAPAASWGVDADADLAAAREVAARTLAEPGSVRAHAAGLARELGVSTTLPLGRPPLGVLQLFHPGGEEPDAEQLTRLATFGVRAAHALRTGERARLLALELERTQALLEVIAQATAELSVSHTLETAVERVAELLGVDRVAVYLRGEGGTELEEAASRGLAGPHARIADRLLDVALGPSRDRGVLEMPDVVRDPRLAPTGAAAARETGIRAALAVPLVARGEVVGLLAAYPRGTAGRRRARDGAARRARRAARGRRPERTAARGDDPTRGRARGGARCRACGGTADPRPLRGLPLVRTEPFSRGDARGPGAHRGRGARSRRRGCANAGRAARAAPAAGGPHP